MVPKHFYTGIIHGAMHRIKTYNSHEGIRQNALQGLIALWKERQYPEELITMQVQRSKAMLFNDTLQVDIGAHEDTVPARYQQYQRDNQHQLLLPQCCSQPTHNSKPPTNSR